jgi:hypothetical protein
MLKEYINLNSRQRKQIIKISSKNIIISLQRQNKSGHQEYQVWVQQFLNLMQLTKEQGQIREEEEKIENLLSIKILLSKINIKF